MVEKHLRDIKKYISDVFNRSLITKWIILLVSLHIVSKYITTLICIYTSFYKPRIFEKPNDSAKADPNLKEEYNTKQKKELVPIMVFTLN